MKNWAFNYFKFVDFRKDYDLSQTDIANFCNVSRNTITSIETGRFQPSLDLYVKLCLSVKVDNLNCFVMYMGGFKDNE